MLASMVAFGFVSRLSEQAVVAFGIVVAVVLLLAVIEFFESARAGLRQDRG